MKSLRQLRKEAELTQSELAQKLGVDQTYISKLEHGIIPLGDSVVQMKLCEALGLSLSEVAPEKCTDRRFPIAVHGQLVYNFSEYYNAVKDAAKHCENCKREFEEMTDSVVKRIREPIIWVFGMSLRHPENEATLKALQAGELDWNKEWREFAEAYFDYLLEKPEKWPKLLKAYRRSVKMKKSQNSSGSVKGEHVR